MLDDEGSSVSLKHYLAVPVRRWLAVVASTLVGLLLAVAYTVLTPATYSATSEVNITVITADPFNVSRSASGLLDTAGEASLAGSFAVAERAAVALDGVSAQQVREAVEVVGSEDSATLRIIAEGPSVEQARALADTVAMEYLAYRTAQADSRIERTVDEARGRLEEARANLQASTERLSAADPGSAAAVQAEVDRSLTNLEIRSVLDELSAAQTIDTTSGTVINPASSAPVDRRPSPVLVLATGVLVGFALGLLIAFVLDALETRVLGRRDVLEAGGGPFVAQLVGREDAFPPAPEDLDQLLILRERLLASPDLAGPSGVVAVVDTTRHVAGAHNVPLALALVLARGGVDVSYVEVGKGASAVLDVAQEVQLATEQQEGFTTYISGLHPGLRISVAEESVTDSEPIPHAVRRMIQRASADSLVMLALPADSPQAAQYSALRVADTTILVVTEGTTRRSEIQQVAGDARLMGSRIAGSITVPRRRRAVTASSGEHRTTARG